MLIITPQNTGPMTNQFDKQSHDDPPPYDIGVSADSPVSYPSPTAEEGRPLLYSPQYAPVNAPTLYNYSNPSTNQPFSTSELPPDHPQMVCFQRGHEPITSFGIMGVLAAIFWFPVGIGCCLLDRRSTCARCGASLSRGLCD